MKLELMGNYPNPFNPETEIRFYLPQKENIQVTVYNSLGQLVIKLFDGQLSTGQHMVQWHGKDQSGRPVSSGLYFYQLATEKKTLVGKMIMMR